MNKQEIRNRMELYDLENNENVIAWTDWKRDVIADAIRASESGGNPLSESELELLEREWKELTRKLFDLNNPLLKEMMDDQKKQICICQPG